MFVQTQFKNDMSKCSKIQADVLLTLFQKKWTFVRNIIDAQSKDSLGLVHGTVEFSSFDPHGILYSEAGVMTLALDKAIQVSREYIYRYHPKTEEFSKHYSKNGTVAGLMYFLNFTDGNLAFGQHLCNKDTYHATYEFFKEPYSSVVETFNICYEVFGPNKNFIIQTQYHKPF